MQENKGHNEAKPSGQYVYKSQQEPMGFAPAQLEKLRSQIMDFRELRVYLIANCCLYNFSCLAPI